MVAEPIPTYLVQTIFQYILPPNLPIPHHLLSTSLLERHHYLSIHPTDVSSYLCWPSTDVDKVVQLLDQTSHQDMSMKKPEHEVCYTASDKDTLLAHVCPVPLSFLRIVFMWDSSTDRWGYHDCRLMPFPSSSHSSVDAAIAARLNPSSRSLSRSSSPDSDYWGGYASSDTSPNIILPSKDIVEDEEKAEAAYWASYGAVHGSGDSTVPSPRLHKQSVPNLPETHGDRTEFDPFLANLHLQLQSKTGFLSPRYSGSERSHSPQPADTLPGDDIADIAHNKYGFSDTPEIRASDAGGSPGIIVSEVLSDDGMDDGGLKETIRGLYHTWKGDSRTKNEGGFVNVVKDALNYKSS